MEPTRIADCASSCSLQKQNPTPPGSPFPLLTHLDWWIRLLTTRKRKKWKENRIWFSGRPEGKCDTVKCVRTDRIISTSSPACKRTAEVFRCSAASAPKAFMPSLTTTTSKRRSETDRSARRDVESKWENIVCDQGERSWGKGRGTYSVSSAFALRMYFTADVWSWFRRLTWGL